MKEGIKEGRLGYRKEGMKAGLHEGRNVGQATGSLGKNKGYRKEGRLGHMKEG